ncbi:MAG TPA: 3-isopropylmalate dehydrogenase [Candidatus Limnocylindrales bacterium]|nr:3-isopropylmalate dehydrogenase [Candidatus Limnocylindrales bacterium]
MNRYRVAFLPGDGIGPEVLGAARRTVDAAGERFGFAVAWDQHAVGGEAIDRLGTALDDATLAACRDADAVLLGAVGGPRWSDPRAAVRPEEGLLRLRHELELFANLRPVRALGALADASPLRPEVRAGADLLIVRELTGGLYFGLPQGPTAVDGVDGAVDTCSYSRPEVERVIRLAFELARDRRRRVTSVDKANVMATGRLWRATAESVAAEFPDVTLDHALVDSFAADLVRRPAHYDVIVTENLFGDILSDEAAVIAGSLGLLASASLGARRTAFGRFGLFEPVHGSAPSIAGRGIADPIGAIGSAALMLRWSLGEASAADALETAVEATLEAGPRTPDLAGDASTEAVTEAVVARLAGEAARVTVR